MQTAFVNGRILREQGLAEGLALIVEGDVIRAVLPAAEVPAGMAREDLAGAILAPGFIDVQVNGGGGVLFNDDPSVEAIRAIGAAHARFGTTGFLPTIISAELPRLRTAIAAVDAAIADGVPGVLGIHIEGPFLSPARKGIHDDTHFRPLDDEALAILTAPRRGRMLVTLAPERADPQAIRTLTESGIIVSAGHTDTDYDTMRRALQAGISGFTHLFNAMSPLRARLPGVVGAALTDPQSWCGIIVDGHHVHPACLKLALAAKGTDRLMLVTDAMPSVGSAEKSFTLQGRAITVRGGVCVGPDGTLAGSDLDMASAVRNTLALMGLDLAAAVRMASLNPAMFLGLHGTMGSLAPGRRADMVRLSADLAVQDRWIGGRRLPA